jgi:hypothetical protein
MEDDVQTTPLTEHTVAADIDDDDVRVDRAGMESFPPRDAPSFWARGSRPGRRRREREDP